MHLFGADRSGLRHAISGKDLLPVLEGSAEKIRDEIIYGYFGKSVNYTDGRYTYFRAAVTPENRPLYIYTAMPATSGKYYGTDSIDAGDYSKIGFGHLGYTDYPVYRIPADIVHITASSSGVGPRSGYNAESLLFDLKEDYAQEHPIKNSKIEEKYIQGLKRCMRDNHAPEEQYERLGI